MNVEIGDYIKQGKRNLILIYVLYVCGIVIPLLPFVGAVFAYLNQEAKDRVLRSHYRFAFRTFLFAAILYIIAFFTMLIFIGFIIYIALFVWFIMRCIIAVQLLLEDQPHPNPDTLWIK